MNIFHSIWHDAIYNLKISEGGWISIYIPSYREWLKKGRPGAVVRAVSQSHQVVGSKQPLRRFAGGRLASVFPFPRPHSCGSLRHWVCPFFLSMFNSYAIKLWLLFYHLNYHLIKFLSVRKEFAYGSDVWIQPFYSLLFFFLVLLGCKSGLLHSSQIFIFFRII